MAALTTLTLAGLLGFGLTVSAQTYNHSNDNEENGSIYDADLSGSEEVPSVSSGVTGYAGVWVSDNDGEDTHYWLDVFDGDDITAAHLHCAPEGENGPVVVGLFDDDDGVDIDGRLAEGDIDDGDIASTGEDCDDTIGYEIESLSDLINAIENGDIYVNVHSEDYPNGAARGQLEFSERTGNGSDHDDDKDKDKKHKDDKHRDKEKNDHRNKDDRHHDKDRGDRNDDHKHDHKDDRNRHNDKDMKDRHNDNRHDKDNNRDKDWDSRRDSDHDKDRDGRNSYDGKDGKDGREGRDGKDGRDGNDSYSKSSSFRIERSHDVDVRGILSDIKAKVFGGLSL